MNRLNASPHDHWADMGLDDPWHRREVEKPRRTFTTPWPVSHEPDWFAARPSPWVRSVGPDELEFMDAIGE